jgi:hypothetical protein
MHLGYRFYSVCAIKTQWNDWLKRKASDDPVRDRLAKSNKTADPHAHEFTNDGLSIAKFIPRGGSAVKYAPGDARLVLEKPEGKNENFFVAIESRLVGRSLRGRREPCGNRGGGCLVGLTAGAPMTCNPWQSRGRDPAWGLLCWALPRAAQPASVLSPRGCPCPVTKATSFRASTSPS